ncbi:MAG TPA: OmpH family outer membrane protein [Kofleriaceae bacterium]|nr:OmpH family outer membrane protein [Kofleriaceae bacterium]
MVSPLLGGIGRSAVPEGTKIAVVDVDNMVQTTPAGKRAKDAFEKSQKTKQATLSKAEEELRKAQEDLIKRKTVLKPEMFDAERQGLEKKFVDLQETKLKLERELAQDYAKLNQDLFDQAKPKIALIAKAEGITVVIDKAQTMYADSAIDLTQRVNAEMK